jgi:CRISP-associated protein Cas1
MLNIYLRPNTTIALAEDSQWLVLLHPEESYGTAIYEIGQVRSIIAFSHVGFEAEVLPKLLQSGINVVFFSGNGEFLGRLESNFGSAPKLLEAQINLSEEQKLHLTKLIVKSALRQHRRLLQRCAREQEIDLDEAMQTLDFSIAAIRQKETIASVAALLGAGSNKYHQGLSQAIRLPGWEYQNRKIATPFTAMLNFGYRLLEQEMRVAIAASGLDPRFGFLHSGADALAKDLASGCRPFIDSVVLRCINRQQVALKDFDGWQPTLKSLPFSVGEMMKKDFEKKLSGKIERMVFRDAIALQTQKLAEYLLGEIEEFTPLEWR